MKRKLSLYWICQISGWGMFLLLISFFYFLTPNLTDFPNYYSVIITTITGLFTSHLMRLFIIRTNLLNLKTAKQVIAVSFTTILFAIVFLIFQLLTDLLYKKTDYVHKINFWDSFFLGIYLNVRFFAIWNLIYFFYHYFQKSRKHLTESIRLESELKIRQLENANTKLKLQKNIADISLTALRSQMNPHFIFNCLNSIKLYTTQNDTASATEFLGKFSKLIRLVMEESAKEKILLSSELNMLQLYIEMEAMRFKEKLQYNIHLEKDVEADYIELPPLLLQPYVENAIWHGLMPKEKGGKINIDVAINNDKSFLQITITDNGIGRAKSAEIKSKTAGNHISYGMKVTSERILLINQVYKTGANVIVYDLIDNDAKSLGTKVMIKIPA